MAAMQGANQALGAVWGSKTLPLMGVGGRKGSQQVTRGQLLCNTGTLNTTPSQTYIQCLTKSLSCL